MIKGIIFDKDGTLFDFNATWGQATLAMLDDEAAGDMDLFTQLADAVRLDVQTRQFYPDSIVIAGTLGQVIDRLAPLLPDNRTEALIDRFITAAGKVTQMPVTPLVPFFDELRGRDLRLGLVTNDGEVPARQHLAAADLTDHFDFIAGYDSGYGSKPAPGQLLAFCAQMGLEPAECVMVGDSLHDLHAGHAAGMRRIGVLTGVATRNDLAPHADAVLSSIAGLPEWLG